MQPPSARALPSAPPRVQTGVRLRAIAHRATDSIADSDEISPALDETRDDTGVTRAAEPGTSPRSRRRPEITIEELMVTARKREERLRDAPLAITALTSRALADGNVRRLGGIGSHVPNLAIDASSDASVAARINLRGVGNGESIATDDPGIGVYVDGVYLARAQGSLLALNDIERVEVIRGPQGTVFGKNTIGGAINVIAVKPNVSRLSGAASLRAGSYDLLESSVAINVPLIPERAAARVSLATATRDGFSRNRAGSDLDDEKLLALRAQLRLVPTDALEIDLALDRSIENRKPKAFKCKVVNPFPAGTDATTRPDLAATGTRFVRAPSRAGVAQQVGVADPAEQARNLVTGTNPFLDACAADALRSARSVASELSFQREDLRTLGTSATLTWDASESTTLRSISSWREQELESARDFDATPLPLIGVSAIDAGRFQQSQISQELQLVGSALDDRLDYLVGAYALIERARSSGFVGFGVGQRFLVPDPAGSVDPTTGLPRLISRPSTIVASRLATRNSTYALFAQASYALTPQLSATLGARLTTERKQVRRDDQCQDLGLVCDGPGQLLFAFERSTRSKDLSPSLGLLYRLGHGTSIYASVSRASKSGGFNGRADSIDLTDAIDDERLTSHELGFKTAWLDDRLQVSGALFDSIYEDIQLSANRVSPATGANQTYIINAGEARIRGAELEARLLLPVGLELATALGVTRARYTEFDAPRSVGDPRIPDDPEDRQLPNTPAYTMNFALSYAVPFGSLGELRACADWTHIGRSGTDTDDSAELRSGKHGELDAQLQWLFADGQTELVLFADNLLDREYPTNGINLGATFGQAIFTVNDPRTYGIELRRRF